MTPCERRRKKEEEEEEEESPLGTNGGYLPPSIGVGSIDLEDTVTLPPPPPAQWQHTVQAWHTGVPKFNNPQGLQSKVLQ